MIVKKIKPGLLKLVDMGSEDNIESFTLLNISASDAIALLYTVSSENVYKEDDAYYLKYSANDEVIKMFNAIAVKHREDNKNFIDVSKKYTIDDVDIEGTSVLVRDSEKHFIKVCKRTSTNCKEGSINRLFISNFDRDRFFRDVRSKSLRYAETGRFELDSRDIDIYSEWSSFMNKRYFEICEQLILERKSHESK